MIPLFSLDQVDVGDFLRFKSCVLYTEYENSDKPLINIEVVAHVTKPELRSSEVCRCPHIHIPLIDRKKINK